MATERAEQDAIETGLDMLRVNQRNRQARGQRGQEFIDCFGAAGRRCQHPDFARRIGVRHRFASHRSNQLFQLAQHAPAPFAKRPRLARRLFVVDQKRRVAMGDDLFEQLFDITVVAIEQPGVGTTRILRQAVAQLLAIEATCAVTRFEQQLFQRVPTQVSTGDDPNLGPNPGPNLRAQLDANWGASVSTERAGAHSCAIVPVNSLIVSSSAIS